MLRAPAPLLLLLLLLGGCEKTSASEPPKKAKKDRSALVQVATAKKGRIEDQWRFLGDVRALSRAGLAAGAQGAVKKVRVREGDAVTKGQLLLEVDAALVRARLAVATANLTRAGEVLAQAEREQKRLDGLENRVVAAVDLERARSRVVELRAELVSQEAAVAQMRAELSLHRIKAPFDGVVAGRSVDPGDWVRPGDPVLELVSTGDVEVLVAGRAELLGYVKKGDAARIVGAQATEGRVAGVVPALDPQSRTLLVRIVPTAAAPWLLPGAEVSVTFSVDLSGKGLIVPQDALLIAPTETKVVKVVEGAAKHLTVEVISKAGTDALVFSESLAEGDQVVTRGNERLRPGQSVEIQK